ncbi:hypothetical protein JCM11491_004980 [Sporobolomyces phaffii]
MAPPSNHAFAGADNSGEQHELDTIRPFEGKRKQEGDHDKVERSPSDSDDNEDHEEEGQGLLEHEDGHEPETDEPSTDAGFGETGEPRTRTRSDSTSSALSHATTRTVRSNSMSKKQKKLFLREMVTETTPVFFLVLIGAILTGSLLNKLQEWRVFIRIEELFILVPILLNLKGNLEMNLAARFSTSANIGELDLRRTRRSLVLGNLALLQVQALIVSLISGLLAFLLGLASRKGVHHSLQHPLHKVGMIGTDAQGNDIRGGYFEALLVLCVSMLAASISSGVLGSFMCALVVLCRRFKINPDNVATPIAAMLGDVVTLVILGGLASLFAKFMGTIISTLVFLLLLVAVLVNLVFTFRNAYVQELLSVGWGPLFLAMAISSGTGVVLETYVNAYSGFSFLAPIFTALSAAPASVFVARTSTALHRAGTRRTSDRRRLGGGGEAYAFTGSVLWVLGVAVIELAWGFGYTTGKIPTSGAFAGAFAIAAGIQTLIGLVIAQQGSMLLWKWDYDPDVYALPLLSSFLDVSGQLLLVAAFEIAKKISPGSATATTVVTGAGGGTTGGPSTPSELVTTVQGGIESLDRLVRSFRP